MVRLEPSNAEACTIQRWSARLGQEPSLGAHLATSRHGYTHHGLYVGNSTVVHYGGFSRSWHSGPEVTLFRVAMGHPIRVEDHPEMNLFAPGDRTTRPFVSR